MSILHDEMSALFYTSFGLDFGTYRSMMAYRDGNDGTVSVARYDNPTNRGGIPSLFMYDPQANREYICDEVVDFNGLQDAPDCVCTSIKTKLELPEIILRSKIYAPAYIAEAEVRHILSLSHEAIEKALVKPYYTHLVVGVPVRFRASTRQKLKDILLSATEHKVDIRLLPEPIAAAIAYASHDPNYKSDKKVLVFDMGAGTFDTSLLVPNSDLNRAPYPYVTKYPDGFSEAGDHLDKLMMTLILHKLENTIPEPAMNHLLDPATADYLRLKENARHTKEVLSRQESCPCKVVCSSGGAGYHTYSTSITRKEFEAVIAPVIDKAVECAHHVLEQANCQNDSNIDILLVGGSTYIPLVTSKLRARFPHIHPSRIFQSFPEESVARGCAIFAAKEVTNTPSAYGYAIASRHPSDQHTILAVAIPSNAKVPYEYSLDFQVINPKSTYIIFRLYEIMHGKTEQMLEVNDGTQTELCIRHNLCTTFVDKLIIRTTFKLTEDGTLMLTVFENGKAIEEYFVRG